MSSILKKLNCEMVEMTVYFNEKDFKKKEFLLDVKAPRSKSDFAYSYGARVKNRNEHAHLYLGLDGEESVLGITYHPGKISAPDIREPYLENLPAWIGSFFKAALEVRFTIAFEFNQTYESLVPLDYPLLINNKWLKGAAVAGYEIVFPAEAYINKAVISKKGKKIAVLLYTGMMVDMTIFNVHKAATAFSVFVGNKSLVTPKPYEV